MGIAKGIAMWISDTAAVPIINPTYSWLFGGGSVGRIPVLLFWMLLLGAAGHFFLKRTTFGRRVLATGGNETAARYSGIDTRSVKFRVLIVSSMAAALAGMLYAGRLHSGRFQLGEGGRTLGDCRRCAWRNQPLRRLRHRSRNYRRRSHDRANK